MVAHRFGTFQDMQFDEAVDFLRKKIFYLLLAADEDTPDETLHGTDVKKAIQDVLYLVDGLNEALFYPEAAVEVVGLLESALCEYASPDFDFTVYRKLILDAGRIILRLKEVCHAES